MMKDKSSSDSCSIDLNMAVEEASDGRGIRGPALSSGNFYMVRPGHCTWFYTYTISVELEVARLEQMSPAPV